MAKNDATKEVVELKAQLARKDKQLAELLGAEAPAPERKLTKEDKALIAEACEVYGIAEQYVIKARIDDAGEAPVAVIITQGGAKVRYAKSMDKEKIIPIEAVRADGVIRKKMKPVTAGKKG